MTKVNVTDHPDFATLCDWVSTNLAQGVDTATLLQSGLDAGHDETLMRAVMHYCTQPQMPASVAAVPWPDLSETSIWVGDRTVRIAAASLQEPKWVLFENLLSLNEVDELIAEAEPHFKPSTGVNALTGKDERTPERTSSGMCFERNQTDLIKRIEERIAALVNWPSANSEGMQVLRYAVGEEYVPHHDFFDPNFPGNVGFIGKAGNRVGTLLIYLNTPEKGGETMFPGVNLKIFPQKGNALLFVYDRPSATTMTEHAGLPVITGSKIVATKWFREKAY